MAWRWDNERRQYFDDRGREVSDAQLHALVEATTLNAERAVERLAENLVAGRINAAEWAVSMRDQIKQGARAMALLAHGGASNMGAREWGRVGAIARAQNQLFARFAAQVDNGDVKPGPGVVARSRLYMNTLYSQYSRLTLSREKTQGDTRARRVLSPGANHCHECVGAASDAYKPLDQVIPIGDTTCGPGCRCVLEFDRPEANSPELTSGDREQDPLTAAKVEVGAKAEAPPVAKAEAPPPPPKTKINYVGRKEVKARIREIMGRDVPTKEIAALSGAFDGDEVTLAIVPGNGLQISVEGRYYREQEHILYRQGEEVWLKNDTLIRSGAAPPGTGTRTTVRQVKWAERLGIPRLTLTAAGDPTSNYNGYYTWPLLGYNGPIPKEAKYFMPAELTTAVDFHDLFSRPGGREWWKANGKDVYLTFKVDRNAREWQILEAYARRKGYWDE